MDILKDLKYDCIRNEYFRMELLEAAKHGKEVYENQVNKLNNLPCIRKENGYKIKDIFREYWDIFECAYKDELRSSVIENVEAMIHCRDFSKGYLAYECPNCHNMDFRGLSCNSRFCTSCGNRYREQRAISVSSVCLYKPHRHFVFSMAYELRSLFAEPKDRDALLDILFKAVERAFEILILNSKKAMKEQRTLGYILFLHTYGRSVNWIPHIHCLICEGYMNKQNQFVKYDYFHYIRLKRSFMYELNNRLLDYFKENKTKKEYDDLYSLTKKLKKKHPDGYYAYGPKLDSKCDTKISAKKLTEYIARYASHPAIAESRILNVDKINHTVTYYYDPHEDDLLDENDPNRLGRQVITTSVFKFMKRLCRHITNKGFHNIRYYGFYSKRDTHDKSKYQTLYTKKQISKLKSNIKWNTRLKNTYHYEVLLCRCGHKMEFCKDLSFFPDKRGKPKQITIYDYDEEGNLYA